MFDANLEAILNVGYAGVLKGSLASAKQLFEGLLAYRPGLAPAKIGLALAYLAGDKFEEAEGLLKEVLENDPKSPEALGFLAFSKKLKGEDPGEFPPEVIEGEGPVASLAKAVMEAGK